MPARIFSIRLSVFNAFLFLGGGIVLPFLPLWLKDRGFDALEIGIVIAAMTAIRVFATPVGAYIADLHGNRRQVILIAAFGSFICFLLAGFLHGFVGILLLTVLAAAFFAPVGPLAEVLSIEGASLHGTDYGRIRLWASLSFLTGSLLSGALLEWIPLSMVIFLVAGAHGLGAAAALILPPDPAQLRGRHEPIALAAAARLLASRQFLLFAMAAGIGQASHGFLYALGSVHWDDLGYSKITIGALWSAAVLLEVLMFAFSNRFFALFGASRLIVVGVGAGLLRWLLMAWEPDLWLMFVAQALHAASFGLTHLGTMHYIRESVPAGMRNTAQGVYSAMSGGILLSATMWTAGPLYGALGGASYFVMAGLSAVALALALRLSPRARSAAAT